MSIRNSFLSAIVMATSAIYSLASPSVSAEPVVDKPAPVFSATAADGSKINLGDFKGKTVVLEWTNHECPFVKKHYELSGNIPLLQKEAVASGVVWLQVISSAPGKQGNVDGAAAIGLNASRSASPTNTLLDPSGEIGKLYGAQTSPHIFIINAQGNLAYKGGIDSIKSNKAEDISKAIPYVKQALDALASGKKVPNSSTAPYGCSVKYAS